MKVRDKITETQKDQPTETIEMLAYLMADCIEDLLNILDQIGRSDLAEPTRLKLGIRRDN